MWATAWQESVPDGHIDRQLVMEMKGASVFWNCLNCCDMYFCISSTELLASCFYLIKPQVSSCWGGLWGVSWKWCLVDFYQEYLYFFIYLILTLKQLKNNLAASKRHKKFPISDLFYVIHVMKTYMKNITDCFWSLLLLYSISFYITRHRKFF